MSTTWAWSAYLDFGLMAKTNEILEAGCGISGRLQTNFKRHGTKQPHGQIYGTHGLRNMAKNLREGNWCRSRDSKRVPPKSEALSLVSTYSIKNTNYSYTICLYFTGRQHILNWMVAQENIPELDIPSDGFRLDFCRRNAEKSMKGQRCVL
jgi:hypothetical protein